MQTTYISFLPQTMRKLIAFDEVFEEMCSVMTTEHTNEIDKLQLRTSVYKMMMYKNIRIKPSGAERMDRIVKMLTTVPGYELSFFQREVATVVLSMVAPVIFMGCSAQEMAMYMRNTNRKMTTKRMALLETSRRSGKTHIMSLLTAIFMLVIPNIEQLAWSLYNEVSEIYGRTIGQWLADLGTDATRFSVAKDHVVVKTDHCNDVRVIYLMGGQNPNVNHTYLHIHIIYITRCLLIAS